MSGIVWLASYPKSGNTWTRALLLALHTRGRAVDINRLFGAESAADRGRFDDVMGFESGLLTAEEAEALRPRCYEHLAVAAPAGPFLKIHDALLPTTAGEALIPARATRAVIYIVRNPLDVAASFANHFGLTLEGAVAAMSQRSFRISEPERSGRQFPQRLLDWSGHVRSWLDAALPLLLVRYEDLKRAPVRELARMAEFLGLDTRPGALRRAVGAARFDALEGQEARGGFREAPRGRRFFRQGQVGGWRGELSGELTAALIARHGPVMKALGYLDPDGQPLRAPVPWTWPPERPERVDARRGR